jgi:hypothetical protein
MKDGEMGDLARKQQDERDAIREPRSETLDDVRASYDALARRWRSYAREPERQR